MISLVLISVNARADFNGSWTGTGTISTGQFTGPSQACTEVDWQLAQTATEFSMVSYTAACGQQNFSLLHTFTFQISGDRLSYQGNPAGTISGDSIQIQVTDLSTGALYTYGFEAAPTGMVNEQWIRDEHGSPLFHAWAALKRQQ